MIRCIMQERRQRLRIFIVLVSTLIVSACGAAESKTGITETVDEKSPTRKSLVASIQEGIEKHAARERLGVALQVNGGAPSEAYFLDLRIAGDGRVSYEYFDGLRSDEEYRGEASLESEVIVELLRKILETGLLEIPESEPRFDPGTTVGKLTITDGVSQVQFYFAADEAQSESQGKIPPSGLAEFVDVLYTMASDLIIGVESVRP